MALNIKIQVTESKDCKNFYFFDSTPLWNAISAPTGYDPTGTSGVNPTNISMVDTSLIVTKPDGTTVSFSFINGDKSITRLIADTRNLVQKTISYLDLGYTTRLADGLYKFSYIPHNSLTGDNYNSSCWIVNDCQACCCLDTKLAAVKFCPDCKDQYNKDIKALYDLYLKRDSARILAACGDYTSATAAIQFILDECGIKNCDNC